MSIYHFPTAYDVLGIAARDKRYGEKRTENDTLQKELAKEDPLSMALKRKYFLSKHKTKAH